MALFDKVKIGNVEVKIYSIQNRGLDYLYIKYHWAGEAKLRTIRHKTKDDERSARQIAREIAGAIFNNRADHMSDIAKARRMLKIAEDLLSPFHIAVDTACREYAQAREILGKSTTVIGAAEYYAKSKPSLKTIAVDDAVKEYLAALKSDGVGKFYLRDNRTRLGAFVDQFSGRELTSITTGEMQQRLRAMQVGPRTKNNYRDNIATFFRWAQTEGYLPKNVATEADELKVIRAPSEIHIHTLETAAALLHGAEEHDPRCIHYLALGYFAFIRPTEITRMTDANIRFEHNDIEILPAIAKGERRRAGRRRLIPIQPSLMAWLESYPLPRGKLTMYKTREFVRRLVRKLKIDWHHDVMRHTGISHAVAMTQNVDQVALWAGNSRDIIYENYLNQVPEREGKLFFSSILPEKSADRKVVRMRG